MTALDATASQAVLFSGNTSVKVTGCVVMSNSNASDAIKLQGSAALQVDCLISAGGVSLSNPVTTVCPAPITQALPVADPFADLPTPAASNPCQNANKSTLKPGTYCSGLSLSGSVTLQPGVYVVQGNLKINANASVTGSGVTIFMAK